MAIYRPASPLMVARCHRTHCDPFLAWQTLKMIAEQLLEKLPATASSMSEKGALFMPGEITRRVLVFSEPVVLFASPSNPGAAEFAAELLDRFAEPEGSCARHGSCAAPSVVASRVSLSSSAASSTQSIGRSRLGKFAIRLSMARRKGSSNPPATAELPPTSGRASGASGSPAGADSAAEGTASRTASRTAVEGAPSAKVAMLRVTHVPPEQESSTSRQRTRRQRAADAAAALSPSSRTPTRRRWIHESAASHMLLYLNYDTFVGENKAELAREVTWAQRRGVPILMVHENDPARGGCAFDRFFQTTPQDLIDAGLYRKIAIALQPGAHRLISLAMAAKGLGASDPQRRGLLGSMSGNWGSGSMLGSMVGSQKLKGGRLEPAAKRWSNRLSQSVSCAVGRISQRVGWSSQSETYGPAEGSDSAWTRELVVDVQ